MTKRFYTILGVFLGILIVLFGLLNKKDLDVNTIVINDNILNNFYLANRNLEDPAFIQYNDLSDIQIALVRDDYIKREVLKREALNWGLDKVDPIISSRLAQLGEQFLVNNLPNEELSEESLNSFYNENKHFYIDDAKVTFSHIFFRNSDEKTINDLDFLLWSWKSDLSLEWYSFLFNLKQDLQILMKKVGNERILKSQTYPLQQLFLEKE